MTSEAEGLGVEVPASSLSIPFGQLPNKIKTGVARNNVLRKRTYTESPNPFPETRRVYYFATSSNLLNKRGSDRQQPNLNYLAAEFAVLIPGTR